VLVSVPVDHRNAQRNFVLDAVSGLARNDMVGTGVQSNGASWDQVVPAQSQPHPELLQPT
jgi:hypothetical protein